MKLKGIALLIILNIQTDFKYNILFQQKFVLAKKPSLHETQAEPSVRQCLMKLFKTFFFFL